VIKNFQARQHRNTTDPQTPIEKFCGVLSLFKLRFKWKFNGYLKRNFAILIESHHSFSNNRILQNAGRFRNNVGVKFTLARLGTSLPSTSTNACVIPGNKRECNQQSQQLHKLHVNQKSKSNVLYGTSFFSLWYFVSVLSLWSRASPLPKSRIWWTGLGTSLKQLKIYKSLDADLLVKQLATPPLPCAGLASSATLVTSFSQQLAL